MARRIRSHAYCSNAGAEGRREADRLNWMCSSPPNNPSWSQAPKVQSAFLFFAAVQIRLWRNSTSFTTFLSASSIFSRFVGAVSLILEEEGLRHQPRLSNAAERPPYIGHKSHFQPKAACKFRGVYFRIESPFARNVLPGTLSALRNPQLPR
jgi:hypothetical protein